MPDQAASPAVDFVATELGMFLRSRNDACSYLVPDLALAWRKAFACGGRQVSPPTALHPGVGRRRQQDRSRRYVCAVS
jgi:hypothetical protein